MEKDHVKNVSKRHNTRLLGVAIMYDLDINTSIKYKDMEEPEVILETIISDVLIMNCEENEEINDLYDLEFLRLLVYGCYQYLDQIDQIINECLVKWTLDRLSYVDRSIIRIATFEMMKNKIAKNIIIDEALELTKELSMVEENNQVKFNNRLLDNIAGKLYG